MKILLLMIAATLVMGEPDSYSGTWKNETNGDTGSLTVTLSPLADNTWNTTFVGKLDEKPFDYNIIMKEKRDPTALMIVKQPLALEGMVSAGGDTFTVSMELEGQKLKGRFRSSASHGDFLLSGKP